MKANELRIGNWVYSLYYPHPFKIRAEHILQLEDGMDELSILAIPLTPEILEKAGFDNTVGSSTSNYKHWCSNGYFDVRFTDKGFTFYHNTGGVKTILGHIQYLHQLQNLYFAQNGEELNIQL